MRPSEKHCSLRSMPTVKNVINSKGKRDLYKIDTVAFLNGMGQHDGIIDILGLSASCPTAGTERMVTTTIFSSNSFINSTVPLHMLREAQVS